MADKTNWGMVSSVIAKHNRSLKEQVELLIEAGDNLLSCDIKTPERVVTVEELLEENGALALVLWQSLVELIGRRQL